ncbi:hypothetical protein LIA77_08128 [Sarocladium implicatum]|nr:hypothetical protein LIA77_08128 [Sarocladium implicatum]
MPVTESHQDVKHKLRRRWRSLVRFLGRYDGGSTPSLGETDLEDFLTVDLMKAGIEHNPVAQALERSYETSLEAYYNREFSHQLHTEQRNRNLAAQDYTSGQTAWRNSSTIRETLHPPKFPITLYHYLYFTILYPEVEYSSEVWFKDLVRQFPIAREINDWARRNTDRWLGERRGLQVRSVAEANAARQLVTQGRLLGLNGCLPSLASASCLELRGRSRRLSCSRFRKRLPSDFCRRLDQDDLAADNAASSAESSASFTNSSGESDLPKLSNRLAFRAPTPFQWSPPESSSSEQRSWPETDAAGSPESRTNLCNRCLGLRSVTRVEAKLALSEDATTTLTRSSLTTSNGLEPCDCGDNSLDHFSQDCTLVPETDSSSVSQGSGDDAMVLMGFEGLSPAPSPMVEADRAEVRLLDDAQQQPSTLSTPRMPDLSTSGSAAIGTRGLGSRKRKTTADSLVGDPKRRKSQHGGGNSYATLNGYRVHITRTALDRGSMSDPEKRGTKRGANYHLDDVPNGKQQTKRIRRCVT